MDLSGVNFKARVSLLPFVVLLLSVHLVHALLGASFSAWALRAADGGPTGMSLLLARLVTHFLTALLFAIVFLLFGLQ